MQRYRAASEIFAKWLQRLDNDFSQLAEEDQDWIIADFVLDLRDEGYSVQLARDAVSALQKEWPRRRFSTSWQVVRGWTTETPPDRAPPMPEEVAMAVVVLLMACGQQACGLAALLAFCGLLRIGEALQLLRKDLIVSDNAIVILLPRTKTGQHQRVVLRNPQVVVFIQRWLAKYAGTNHTRVCHVSYATFRTWLARTLKVLGCENFKFRSHSFRRGAATALFQSGVPLQTVMILGRWASESSCRLYVQAGEAAMIAILRAMSASSRERVRALSSLGHRVFDLSVGGPTG